MSSVTATINVQINAANAAAQLTALQGKVAAMNKGMLAATAGGVMAQEKAIRRMGNVLTGSGMFTTGIRSVHTELGRLHQEFDRGSTSLQNYRRNSRTFSRDHSQVNRMAADRVRMLQSQYVALGKEMNGVQQAMQIKPTGMMKEFGAETMYANQRATLFRRNLQMGSTALVNWGKNTQWAGRQMMVGMGIPIAIMAAGAVKSYNDIEKASIAFKRVYGDTTTDVAEKTRMLGQVQNSVGKEMMKYGVAMSDTLDVSAKAAATGAKGADLIAATRETMRLATLGNMDYNKALEATIAMQTAFNINSKDMANTTDFLNAVENQTILSMEDMALAVPRVAPVIKGLGGNVKDLAVMMTALRQGGVSAEQGANALKSGLGSLLNPTGTAIDQFDNLGINLKKIVNTNKGDLIGTLRGLGTALDGLTKYDRQRALESLFGKYQYARMGALLKNINSKAVRETLKMAKASPGELAKMSQQELSQISDSPMIKLKASIEELKAAAAPLGALFSDIAAKIISAVTPVVEFFANNDAAKWGLVAAAGFAALAGTVTMVVGVFANFAGSMVKAGMAMKSFFRFLTGQRSLAYVATDELNATAAANSLATASERAATGLYAQANAAKLLTSQLEALIAAQTGAAGTASRAGTVASTAGSRVSAAVPKGYTAAEQLQMVQTTGNTVRAHVGQPQVLTAAQTAALKSVYLDANGNPLSSKGQRAIDIKSGIDSGSIRGYSAMTLGWGDKTNTRLAVTNKAGVPTQHLLDQLRMRPHEVLAPFLDDLARNSNQTTAQVMADKRVQTWGSSVISGLRDGITNAGVTSWHDTDIARVAEPLLQTAGKIGPEYQSAVAKMMLPEQILATPGSKRFQVPAGVANLAPEEYAQPRPKTATTGKAVEASAALIGKLGSTPQVLVDDSGKPTAVVQPKGSATPQAKRLISPPKLLGASPMKINYSEQAKAAIDSKGPTKVQPRTMSGMGLMGAGMLASTALMGMEMAGKQVPAAATFAANGLMGIGMTAQMFPGTMAKLSSGFLSVAGLLGPLGLAVGATATVVAGSALLWRSLNQKWRRDGVSLGKATTDATQGLEEVGSIFGKTGYVQRQIAADQKTTTESMSTGEKFLDSDVGKQWLDDYAKTAGDAGVATATGSFASKLATAVVNGVMGTEDVRGVFAALTKDNAVMASSVRSDFLELVGGSMKKIDPFAASLAINEQNAMQTQALTNASRLKIAQSMQPQPNNWAAILPAVTAAGPFAGFVAQASSQALNTRQLMQENAGLAAGAWSGTIATAFQNRLAAEAQLQQMITARDDLAAKKDRTGAETRQMNNLTDQIANGTQALGKMDQQVHQTLDGMEELYNSGDENQQKAMRDSIFESLGQNDNKMTKLAGAMLEGSQIGDQRLKFTMAVALESGTLQPEAMMNMFNQFGSADAAATRMEVGINTIGTAPAMDFFNALATFKDGKQQAALRNFGTEFGAIANKAKLSANEAIRLAAAMKGSDLTKGQTKAIRIAFKGGEKDPTKNYKDKNIKVTAKGEVSNAKKNMADLNKEVDKTGKKKVSVKAKVDGATKGISDLRSLGKAADGADKKKIKIDADTRNAEAKARQISGVINNADPKPIPITATDQTTAVAVAIQAQLVSMQAVAAVPMTITAVNNASSTLTTIIGQLAQIQSKTVTVTVNKVENDAIGGPFGYASGGIHNGDGEVNGPGGPTADKVNARLSAGEYVIRASSVKKYGQDFMAAINHGVYDKNGFAKGTPGTPISAKGMDKDERKEYKGTLNEARGIIKEISRFKDILAHGRKLLGKGLKNMDQEFAQYIIENYDPKQIKKMFQGKNDAGAKVIAKKFRAEQRQASMAEFGSQRSEADASVGIQNLYAKKANEGARKKMLETIASMSSDQYNAYRLMKKKNKSRYLQNITTTTGAQEDIANEQDRRQRVADARKAYKSSTGQDLDTAVRATGVTDITQLSKYAEALGLSMSDIAQQAEDSALPKNFAALGEAAIRAAEKMDILSMSASQRAEERLSNNQTRMGSLQNILDAAGRRAVVNNSKLGGKSQGRLEAESAKREAEIAIKQAEIDDINKSYEDQLETFDKIAQQQQAIANLERGRMSVANALSQGDIAAAAMAAQQQRNDTAAFMQDQMRNQMENQQKARTLTLQNEINSASKTNRDIQNLIALDIATAALNATVLNTNVIDLQASFQAENDLLVLQEDYWKNINAEIERRNKLLVNPTAEDTGRPAPEYGSEKKVGNIKGKGKKMKFKGKAFGGWIPGIGNSDSVPVMATPGEYIVNKAAAARFGPTLNAINHGSLKAGGSGGGDVRIDNIIFQISGANLNERDVADIAVRKMKSLDSATIRGGRF